MPEKQIKEILNFIKRRFPIDCNWTSGNCWWFASILKARFPNLSIYYLPVAGHFVAGAMGVYFDWTGRAKVNEPVYLFEELLKNEDEWGWRLVRDCIL